MEEVDRRADLLQEDALGGLEVPRQRLAQVRKLRAHPPTRELGDRRAILLAREQVGRAGRSSRSRALCPKRLVATEASVLVAPSRTFCRRLTSCVRCWTSALWGLAVARELAQRTHGSGRDAAGQQQAMPQEIGEPSSTP